MPLKIITSVEVTAATQSTIEIQNIPQTFTHLLLVASLRTTNTQYGYDVRIRPNGLTTNALGRVNRAYSGTSVQSYTNANYIAVTDNSLGNGATSGVFDNAHLLISNYASSSPKAFSAESISETNATDGRLDFSAGIWQNSAAITSLTLDSPTNPWSFIVGSVVTLYGISR